MSVTVVGTDDGAAFFERWRGPSGAGPNPQKVFSWTSRIGGVPGWDTASTLRDGPGLPVFPDEGSRKEEERDRKEGSWF